MDEDYTGKDKEKSSTKKRNPNNSKETTTQNTKRAKASHTSLNKIGDSLDYNSSMNFKMGLDIGMKKTLKYLATHVENESQEMYNQGRDDGLTLALERVEIGMNEMMGQVYQDRIDDITQLMIDNMKNIRRIIIRNNVKTNNGIISREYFTIITLQIGTFLRLLYLTNVKCQQGDAGNFIYRHHFKRSGMNKNKRSRYFEIN